MKTPYPKLAVIFVAIIFSFASCKYARDADLRLARDFIDAYYVEADQKQALALTSGRAEELIKKELELLEGVPDREMSYKTRDVVFELTKEDKTAVEVNYFYNLKIIQPGVTDMQKRIHIVVDRAAGKVKDFRTIE